MSKRNSSAQETEVGSPRETEVGSPIDTEVGSPKETEMGSPKALLESGDYGGLQKDDRGSLQKEDRRLEYPDEKALGDQHDTYKTVYAASPPPPFGQTMSEMPVNTSTSNLRPFKIYPEPPSDTVTPISPEQENGGFPEGPKEEKALPEKPRTIYGMRRRTFFILLAAIIIIAIAVIVGGAVGGVTARNKKNNVPATAPSHTAAPPLSTSSSPPTSSSSAPTPVHALLSHDPIPGTSISTLGFTSNNGTGSPEEQDYRLYYQEAGNSIQEVVYDSTLHGWTNSTPIFTDASNYTGLATFTYMNGSDRMERIYYQGSSYSLLQEKVKAPDEHDWLPGTLNAQNVNTNTSSLSAENNGAAHISAVYSTVFGTGPGARVFYHVSASKAGSQSWVQELIWTQNDDKWVNGAQIKGPISTSQLAVTVQGDYLRLFYTTGSGTLQESWVDIRDTNANYTTGVIRPDTLGLDDGALSALSVGNSTFVYFVDGGGSIRELNLTGSSPSSQSVNLNPSKIATPNKQNPVSLATAIGPTQSSNQSITVYYTDLVDGVILSTIVQSSRSVTSSLWPENASANTSNFLPLGNG